jgi:glucose dehydrogenase
VTRPSPILLLGLLCRATLGQTALTPAHGSDTVQRICSGCHSINIVTAVRHSRGEWQTTVQDMIARGAIANRDEVTTIVNYLATNYASATYSSAAGIDNSSRAGRLDGSSNRRHFDESLAVPPERQWTAFGHDLGAQRYSPLTQITPKNVARLQRAWTFHLGTPGSEAIPLVIGNRMYVTAPDAIYALEPETGKQIWKYASQGVARRGLAYWSGSSVQPRIYCGVETGKLVALDAATGKPISSFGDNGLIDLRQGVAGDLPDARFYLGSPPAIYKNIVITGGSNGELAPSTGAYGDVRGWDATTGKLLWTFHTVPRPGEPGNETWAPGSWEHRSGTNVWGFMTIDSANGLVYLPIGCPTSDMYGADRPGNGLYGNSLVALDASTGKVRWYRQLVHHDLWDYDPAAPPALIDIVVNGNKIPAVAQITKTSLLFVFNRLTGEPVFGLEERPVSASVVPGEVTSPTQPFPLKPPPLAKVTFSESDIYDLTPEHAKFCRDLFSDNKMENHGPYTPMPLVGNALTFPSTLGGGNWGGVSYDPTLQLAFTNVMNVGQWGHMEQKVDKATGKMTYMRFAGSSGAYGRFWNPASHTPCTKPPFGELVAVNMRNGDIAWRVALGINAMMEARGIHNTGTVSLGGVTATASGLLFIGATNDDRIRAFDSRTGKELWQAKLDTSAYTVPVTYQGRDGRQYVTIVAGGAGYFGSAGGDSVTTFALP